MVVPSIVIDEGTFVSILSSWSLFHFFKELDIRQRTLLHTLDHNPKEAMASKRFSSDGRAML